MNEVYVLRNAAVITDRAAQREVLHDILNVYRKHPEALDQYDQELFRRANGDEVAQQRVIVDRVARMTDRSAEREHKRLRGAYFSRKRHFPLRSERAETRRSNAATTRARELATTVKGTRTGAPK